MVVGALGDVVFSVSENVVKTIEGMKWDAKANYAEHSLLCGNTLTEFTGLEAEEISFDIILSCALGVEPMDEIAKLLVMERQGKAVAFTLGTHAYGRYKWVIESLKIKMQNFDRNGDVYSAEVGVNLKEYCSR